MEYVLVYARPKFDEQSRCLVILKNRPVYLAGKLNLPGGKIENNETPEVAGIRELKEETGLDGYNVLKCGEVKFEDNTIHCISVDVDEYDFKTPKTQPGETESCRWVLWHEIRHDHRLMPNLKLIVPMMQSRATNWTLLNRDEETNTFSIQIN